jgi:alkanesulfonate monooxygenase SsuD/methylene tetrahydromethanopterin reductase-like flavin-dependent oxidoreductase (luciferase family)
MRLSVLDQSPVPEGSTGADALRNTLDLAQLADRLGYERYWLAEHHGLSLAGPSPELLIGPVAAATERIRVGSGGVMLPHYSPYKVAENFADFINPRGAEIMASYRERAEHPRTAVGVWAICADSDEEAERLASSIAMSMAMLRQNRPIPVPPPEKALRFLAQNPAPSGRRRIVGSPQTVRAGIENVAAEYGADEVIIVTITYDHAARRRSYELIAEAFGLAGRPLASARWRSPASTTASRSPC